ncbi:hypothetical protein Q7F20_08775 [Curtobacterium sp. A7_M15]|uniref:hypothetical protein n=1 Tax=Curtobacterium sp. A7_M15 TaxID=3065241 RepID=UPI002737A13C|nr:hypothetical protein [Curtobacterium sp. A7_M15]MDP4333462.1 hypothetical protein [Curtobacterium sp. A7_M15]
MTKTTTGVTMHTTNPTTAMAARADLVRLVGTAPDARPRIAAAAVAPYPFPGTPAVTAPLSA